MWRENEGLSQSELARRTGIKQQKISRWESNSFTPDVIECLTLAKFFGVTIEELIGSYENVIYTPQEYIMQPNAKEEIVVHYRSKGNKVKPKTFKLTQKEQQELLDSIIFEDNNEDDDKKNK